MNSQLQALQWIDTQRDAMLRLVTEWAGINSGTYNLQGLARLASAVDNEFAALGARRQYHELPPAESIDSSGRVVRSQLGKAISFVKRPEAPVKVLLCIHLDTVYAPENPFLSVTKPDPQTLQGPGVADAKGGLVVLLTALRAFEKCDVAAKVGWEVLLNPDEEIGSPGSAQLLTDAAGRNHVGLVFEPSLPDGSLVGTRKGSGNFTVVVRGRAAHSGRDFHLGRSAVLALAQFVTRLDSAQSSLKDVTINCGRIEGGGAVNVVPDLAIGRFNVRVSSQQDQQLVEQLIRGLVEETAKLDGISVTMHGGLHSPPKPMDARSSRLFELAQQCGAEIGLQLEVKPSGGACDGNRLAAAGLAVIDTLGPQGGNLHSDREYILIGSLAERAKLTAMLLIKLAEQEFASRTAVTDFR